ncbi:hypothetical protein VTO42DRAFT_4893 [Malbranchea cinnamomea]
MGDANPGRLADARLGDLLSDDDACEKPQQHPIDSTTTGRRRRSSPGSNDNTDDDDTINHRCAISNNNDSNSPSPEPSQLLADIEYRYLSFDTDLPSPSLRTRSATSNRNHSGGGPDSTGTATTPPPPEPPDLRPYLSPLRWSRTRKTFLTLVACAGTILSAVAAGSYSLPQATLSAEWGVSHVAYNVGITLFCVGFGIAPMVLAPFSEINGRRPMFLASGVLFTVCHVGCGATNSYAGMLLARFFLGVGGSTFSTMVGGVISDIYEAEDRNTPMALFSGSAMFGTGLGPLFAGFVVQHSSWRWVFYAQAIASAALLAVVVVFFQETRGSVLLSRKARALNKYYEALEAAGYVGVDVAGSNGEKKIHGLRIRWKVKSDEERETLAKMIGISLYRPFPMCIGSILATILAIWQDKLARRFSDRFTFFSSSTPEGRLTFVCFESILMPAGMFWFGWSSFASVPWIVPTLAVGCATIGIFTIYLAVFNYLADVYHRYASSALAAQSCCRNLLGGAFPLVTAALFNNLGYPEASSLLGGIGALLTIVPWVLLFFGPQIRARSKIASEIMSDPD